MEDESTNYNWPSVITFIQKQHTKNSLREKEWLFEKQCFQQKINRLSSEIQSNEIIQKDLLKRIKLLQVALLQERLSKNSTKKTVVQLDFLSKYPQLQKKIKQQNHDQFLKKYIYQRSRIMADFHIDNQDIPQQKSQIHFFMNQNKLQLVSSRPKDMQPINKIAAHLDSIWKIHANEQLNYLASVSEDCLLKLWSFDQLVKDPGVQPTASIRKHTGPLFSLSGYTNPSNPQQHLILTAGSQGVIHCWNLFTKNTQKNLSIQLLSSWQVENSEKVQDHAIWQLQCNQNKLLSSISDGTIRLYQFLLEDKQGLIAQQKCQYREKQFHHTSICWISDISFLAGCQNAPRILLWNLQGRIFQKYLYEVEKNKDLKQCQVNCLQYLSNYKMVISGCEDKFLRIYDFNSSKIKQKIQCSDSISCISKRKQWQFICGEQNGSIKIWDIRKYAIVAHHNQSHLMKFDEGLHSILVTNNYLLSSGADGVINVYK